jgi:protochlorophyllide reductase
MKFSARLRLFSGIVLIMHEVLAVRLMMNNADKRTVIITGANRGIGLAATKALAATSEWNIVMACRSKARGDYAKLSLPPSLAANIEVKELDLADLRSIDSFVEDWGKRPLHVLACNAGIQKSKSAGFGGPEDVLPERTAQGFEATVGTNHIGHFHLVKKLLKNVNAVDKGRIVYVGSGVHNPEEPGGDVGSKAGLGDLRGLEQGFKAPVSMVDGSAYDPDKAYKDSKLVSD